MMVDSAEAGQEAWSVAPVVFSLLMVAVFVVAVVDGGQPVVVESKSAVVVEHHFLCRSVPRYCPYAVVARVQPKQEGHLGRSELQSPQRLAASKHRG